MNSDIKLDGRNITIEGFSLNFKGADLKIDHQSRREGSRTPYRRALVHAPGDGLTINWSNDYTGGVQINGVVSFTGSIKCADMIESNSIKCADMMESNRLVVTHHLGVSESGSADFLGNVKYKKAPVMPDILIQDLGLSTQPTIRARGSNRGLGNIGGINISGLLPPEPASLVEIIKELRTEIEKLQERVQVLES